MPNAVTQHMLEAYENDRRPSGFFTGQFRSPARNFHKSSSVTLDIRRGSEDIAIVITDLATGTRMNADDIYTNKEFTPPIFDESFAINSYDLINRQFGMNPYESPSFQADAMTKFMIGMRKVEDKIARAIELQCAQVMQTGALSLINSAGTVLYTVNFMPKATHMITAGTAWNAVGADIVGNLETAAGVVRSDGLGNPDMIEMGIDAWNVAIADTNFKALFETRRADLGRITPMQSTGNGGNFRGVVEIGNYSMELWTYDGRYKHPQTGVSTPYLTPANVIVRDSSAPLDLTFGAIPMIVPPEARVLPFLPPRISRPGGGMDLTTNAWVSNDGKHLFGSAGTRPMAIPTAIDSFARIATGV